MSNYVRWSVAASAAAAILILVGGCYYMPGSTAGNARVALAVKGVPANLSSVALVVTGPGMATVSTTASTSAGSVTISVPAGPARTFTLLLNGPSATLEGIATVDLQPGENKTINVTPTLGATQLVIPDTVNFRIVQISDMMGTGWTVLDGNGLSARIDVNGGKVLPGASEIDFDGQGRMYVASGLGLFRIDDIKSGATGTEALIDGNATTTVAIDRLNNVIYYANGGLLQMRDIPTLTLASDDTTSVVTGIASDNQGLLFLVSTLTTPTIFKYDTSLAIGSRKVGSYTYPPGTVGGIMVKGQYVYVCNTGLGRIDRFDKNLNFIDSFSGPATDAFYGPERFVATLNRKFTVIDEKNGGKDRLASFDDMSGAGWITYGTNGSASAGPGFFDFYSAC